MEAEGPQEAGHPAHPEDNVWLVELGRLTRAAAQLATICFDLARIVGGINEKDLYDDPLGRLQTRLSDLGQDLPRMGEFLDALDAARHTRNDVLHSFLVRDGLLRRSAKRSYDRPFYGVRSLIEARQELEHASMLGNEVLYSNGGAIVEAWRQRDV